MDAVVWPRVANLNTVTWACGLLVEALTDPQDETPFTLEQFQVGGEDHFRFVQKVWVQGRLVEVEVRTVPDNPMED